MTEPAPDAVGEDLTCSARGCRHDAAWGVLWNNPRLHTPQRRKVWLACDEHREHLEEYLRVRAFWKATVPVAELPTVDQGERPGSGAPGAGGATTTGPDLLGLGRFGGPSGTPE